MRPERRGDGGVGLFAVDLPVVAKEHAVRGVHERIAKRLRHEPGGEIFAAGDKLVRARVPRERGGVGVKFVLYAVGKPQLVADGDKPLADRGENVGAGNAVDKMCVAKVQKIGELMVAARALPGGGDHDDPAALVRKDDVAHLAELLAPGDG